MVIIASLPHSFIQNIDFLFKFDVSTYFEYCNYRRIAKLWERWLRLLKMFPLQGKRKIVGMHSGAMMMAVNLRKWFNWFILWFLDSPVSVMCMDQKKKSTHCNALVHYMEQDGSFYQGSFLLQRQEVDLHWCTDDVGQSILHAE